MKPDSVSGNYRHLFSEPNICLAQLQMELCQAANIFAAHQNKKSAFSGFVEMFGFGLKVMLMITK